MQLSDFPTPTTGAAAAARSLASRYHSAALTAHAIRSWLWAEAIAATEHITDVDHELLYVASMLHDIGTVTEFDNHTLSYEDAGGHVAIALTTGAGWHTSRQRRVLEVIVRHNWPSVEPDLDLEGHLLERATGIDISGRDTDLLPIPFLREMLTAYPRGDLATEFSTCVADQARRKPHTAARRLIDGGITHKLTHNPLEQIQWNDPGGSLPLPGLKSLPAIHGAFAPQEPHAT